MVNNNVDINKRNLEGITALMCAAGNGHLELVQYLLDNGAHINARSTEGGTALYFAFFHGHHKVANLLLERGADPRISLSGILLKIDEDQQPPIRASILKYAEEKRYLTTQKAPPIQSTPMATAQQEIVIPSEDSAFSNQWAVIIGISKYQHSGPQGLPNLIFADDDARLFSYTLQRLGWSDSHIKTLINENATQRKIMIALESWLTKAGPNDQIVLFWAGHGYPDPEDPEKVYFACYDTDINIPVTGFRMDRVRAVLEERKVKNVVVLADTCHAGKIITRGGRGISVVPEIEKLRRERKIPKGWVFMVGADTDRQAIEHTSWTNGAFTHCLIKGLSGEADGYESVDVKDGIVTMRELRAFMNTVMPGETQKVLGTAKRPVITTSTGDPAIWDLSLQAK